MVYLVLLGLVTLGLIAWGLTRRDRIYQFPFLAGVTAAAWLLPQAVGLTNFVLIPDEAVTRMLLMSVLCMTMIYVGYAWPKKPLQSLDWRIDERRMLQSCFVLVTVGGFFYVLIYQLPESLKRGTWTGLPVAYLFFARLADYGFAIAVLLYARSRSRAALGIALLASPFYVEKIFFGVRRAEMAEVFVIICLAAWFGQRKSIPRTMMVVGLLAGMLVINANIGELRGLARDGLSLQDIQRIEWTGNINRITSGRAEFITGTELEAGAYSMEVVEEGETYDLGLYHWNRLVFNYVPAQIFGAGFKRSFYLGLAVPREGTGAYERFGYTKHTGHTTTGFSDAFNSFWYFGCLKFFLVAFIMSKLFLAANQGHFVAQLLCMILTVPAMHIVTHNTHWFFQDWPHMLAFIGPALYYARQPALPSRRQPFVESERRA